MKKFVYSLLLLALSIQIGLAQDNADEVSINEERAVAKKNPKEAIAALQSKIKQINAEIKEAKSQKNIVKEGQLKAEIKELKLHLEQLKMQTKNLVFVAMPLYMKDPMLGNSVGVAATLAYNLDPKRESPFSTTAAIYAKALDNPGYMIQLANYQYLNKDKYRLHQQWMRVSMYQDMSFAPDQISTMEFSGDLFIFKAWRKLGNSNWYLGPRLEYTTITTDWSGDGKGVYLPEKSSSSFLAPGIALDYDNRDNKMFPTKGFFSSHNWSYLGNSLGYESIDPYTGMEYDDAQAYYLEGNFDYFYSPTKNWNQVFSFRLKYDYRTGDIGTAQNNNNSQRQRGFQEATLTANSNFVFHAEYNYFIPKLLKGRLGLAAFSSYGIYGEKFSYTQELDDNGSVVSTKGASLGVGGGLRYMASPKAGLVIRADYGYGMTFGASDLNQTQFGVGVGKYF